MSIRPLDLQVAVPKMAELERTQKAVEQPQYSEVFANEVQQTLHRKERAVQHSEEVAQGRIDQKKDQTNQRRKEQKDGRPKEKTSKTSEGTVPADRSRGTKLDIRI